MEVEDGEHRSRRGNIELEEGCIEVERTLGEQSECWARKEIGSSLHDFRTSLDAVICDRVNYLQCTWSAPVLSNNNNNNNNNNNDNNKNSFRASHSDTAETRSSAVRSPRFSVSQFS